MGSAPIVVVSVYDELVAINLYTVQTGGMLWSEKSGIDRIGEH